MAEGREIPRIVSIDDHVVEPPHLWERWLPARLRERGPRVARAPYEPVPGMRGAHRVAASGPETDFWFYEDTAKPIPLVMACAGYRIEDLTLAPVSFADMRPGCYDPQARLADM